MPNAVFGTENKPVGEKLKKRDRGGVNSDAPIETTGAPYGNRTRVFSLERV